MKTFPVRAAEWKQGSGQNWFQFRFKEEPPSSAVSSNIHKTFLMSSGITTVTKMNSSHLSSVRLFLRQFSGFTQERLTELSLNWWNTLRLMLGTVYLAWLCSSYTMKWSLCCFYGDNAEHISRTLDAGRQGAHTSFCLEDTTALWWVKGAGGGSACPPDESHSLCTNQGVEQHWGQTCEVTTGKRNDKKQDDSL